MWVFTISFYMKFMIAMCMSYYTGLPREGDLETYVNSVEESVFYILSTLYSNNTSYLKRPDATRWSIVVSFANLNKISRKIVRVPTYIGHKLPSVLGFLLRLMVLSAKQIQKMDMSDKEFIAIIGQEGLWEKTLENFEDLDVIDIELNNAFDKIPFDNYYKNHNYLSTTDAKLFESCFHDLAKNVKKKKVSQCNIDLRCVKLISNQKIPTGRELNLWLYFFTYTRFSCQCYVLTPSRDKEIVHKLCSIAFNEIIYLHKHQFEFMDTALEKATLCTLLGYAQFLNRTWITTTLGQLTQKGCYVKPNNYRRKSDESKTTKKIVLPPGPVCSPNITALATAVMTLALRYTIDRKAEDSTDAKIYMNSIETALDYLESKQVPPDLNVLFGVFLSHMLLRKISFESKITDSKIMWWAIPAHDRLKSLLQKVYDNLPKQSNSTVPLFKNETPWVHSINQIRIKKIKSTPRDDWLLFDTLPFSDVTGSVCVSYLAKLAVQVGPNTQCKAPKTCLRLMSTATSPGSPYKYKLLYLLFAEYARNCFFFSRIQDGDIKRELCTIAKGQVQYLIENNTDAMDFILEQVVLCAYHGYGDFLQSKWLSYILSQQDSGGCYLNKKRPKTVTVRYVPTFRTITEPTCDSQTTLFATSLVSMAIRYIIDSYF